MASSEWRLLRAQFVRRVLSPGGVVAHIGVFLVSGTILLLANAIGNPGTLWFWRPLLVLSAILALHATIIVTAGRTSRLRAAAAWAGSAWTEFRRARPGQARGGVIRSGVRSLLRRWEQALAAPALTPSRVDQPALVPAPSSTHGNGWSQLTPADPAHSSWPALVTTGQSVTTRQEPPPDWAASWPTPPGLASNVPIRPTGTDRVIAGLPIADSDNPRWDQLEVAATTWLAHRSTESTETAR